MEDRLPNDPNQARKTAREASKYTLVRQQLCRRGFSFSLLRCIDKEESNYAYVVLTSEVEPWQAKLPRQSYYWPTLKHDCMEYIRKCKKCQRFAEAHKAPLERLHSVTSPWPFYKWGVDILGPFPTAPG
ncbi:hypothetical protein CR513_56335, partial [Mucuna pruriens]